MKTGQRKRERNEQMNGKYKLAGISLIMVATVALLLASAAGCGGPKSVEEIWKKSLEAQKNITSMHMNVSLYYQNTKYGSGLIQTTSIDVNGENGHLQTTLFGLEFSEVFVVDGKQYSKAAGSDKWTEGSVTQPVQNASQQMEQFSNLPSLATSQENLGVEKIGGVEAYHLSFQVPPQSVGTLFPNVPVSQLSANAGAKVEVWIDKDKYYEVKYEALISNVSITDKIGNGDVRIVSEITEINKPIVISPPI
jgi:hypothetical protein